MKSDLNEEFHISLLSLKFLSMKTSKFNPIRFKITGECVWPSIRLIIKFLENFTSEAGCIKICSQKYYYPSFPSVDDMALLSEREVDQGDEWLKRSRIPL